MEKPINLIMEEAKKEYVDAINEVTKKYNISMYLVEIIIGGIYNEINNIKMQELALAKAEYEKEQIEGSFLNEKESEDNG